MKNELWFLVWRPPGKAPYVTSICSYTREGVYVRCVDDLFGSKENWRRARQRGARIERINVVPSAIEL